MLTLNIQTRDVKKSPADYRAEGLIPCVFYGPKDDPVAIAATKTEFLKVLREAGETTVIALEGMKEKIEALVHDVSYDPVTGEVIHVDFYVPEKGKKVEIEVPLEFVGVSVAVKDFGGTLVKVLHELEIEALPANLPRSIKVDISKLSDVESQILARDLVFPEGVTLITDPEEVVASIAVAKEEAEPAPAADLSSIELSDKKGKKEEEGGEKK